MRWQDYEDLELLKKAMRKFVGLKKGDRVVGFVKQVKIELDEEFWNLLRSPREQVMEGFKRSGLVHRSEAR